MRKRPQQEMIDYVLGALRTGSLASALPELLMDEFHISEVLAGEFSALAIKRHKTRSKLDPNYQGRG